MRACSGVRRVTTSMRCPPASRVTARMRSSSRSARAAVRCWSGEVGVADVGGGEVAGDQRFDDGGVDAHGDVAADASFGPVPHRAQVQEVLEHPEAVLDGLQLPVGDDDVGGGGLVGGEAGDEHVAAGEHVLVGEGGRRCSGRRSGPRRSRRRTGARPRRGRGCVGRRGRSCRHRRGGRPGRGLRAPAVGSRCGRRARRCGRVSRRCRSRLATTTARRPSARVTSQAAEWAAGTGTHRASGLADAVSASAQVGSRCSRVAMR